MSQSVYTGPDVRPTIDSDDVFAGPVQIPSGGSPAGLTNILTYQTKPGKRCFISVLANDVDQGGIGSVYFRLAVNGSPLPRYTLTPNQWGSPQLLTPLPVRIEVPQLATVTVDAYNSSGTNRNAFARIIFEYEDFAL